MVGVGIGRAPVFLFTLGAGRTNERSDYHVLLVIVYQIDLYRMFHCGIIVFADASDTWHSFYVTKAGNLAYSVAKIER